MPISDRYVVGWQKNSLPKNYSSGELKYKERRLVKNAEEKPIAPLK